MAYACMPLHVAQHAPVNPLRRKRHTQAALGYTPGM
jgi:hypothetical protein